MRLLGPRRAAVVDRDERQPDEAFGERLGVGDGGRGEHELRVAAVVRAEAPQAADHLGHVPAEHAAVDVGLVEHDVAQMVQELGPALVAGQDADVEHVGVGEQDGRAAPDARPLGARRVAVVERGGGARQSQRGELARLVLGERLGGVEEQRPAAGLARDGFERRQGEGQGLAAGRAGGDDHVAPVAEQVPDAALVA